MPKGVYKRKHPPWNKGKKIKVDKLKDYGNYRHGMRHTRFYNIWRNMKTRCNQPTSNHNQTNSIWNLRVLYSS